jgi:hypothetical protein
VDGQINPSSLSIDEHLMLLRKWEHIGAEVGTPAEDGLARKTNDEIQSDGCKSSDKPPKHQNGTVIEVIRKLSMSSGES